MLMMIAVYGALLGEPPQGTPEDLRAVSIPADAIEKPGRIRPLGRVNSASDFFVDGVRVARREFYDNGNVAHELLYRAGELHGVSRDFYLNGKPYAERPYRDGVMDGEFRYWDEDGALMGSSLIKQGTGLLRKFDRPGVPSADAEIPYRNGRIHGRERLWGKFIDCRGIGYSVSDYVDGKLVGVSVTRHDDGLILSWAFFTDGQLDGPSVQLQRNGDPAPGFPEWFLRGELVTAEQYQAAAAGDPELARRLEFRPPKYAEIPESPSQAFDRKRKASQRPQTKGKAGTKAEQKGE